MRTLTMANLAATCTHWKPLRGKTLATGFHHVIPLLTVGILFFPAAYGQTSSLILSSGQALQGTTTTLSLSLTSLPGSEPAGAQWTFTYDPGLVSAISASAGPVAVTAGKLIACADGGGSYGCLVTGINSNVLQNGTVANIKVTLSPTASGSIFIGVANTSG